MYLDYTPWTNQLSKTTTVQNMILESFTAVSCVHVATMNRKEVGELRMTDNNYELERVQNSILEMFLINKMKNHDHEVPYRTFD